MITKNQIIEILEDRKNYINIGWDKTADQILDLISQDREATYQEGFIAGANSTGIQADEIMIGKIRAIEGLRLGGHKDEDKRIYAGGNDDAIDQVLSILNKRQ